MKISRILILLVLITALLGGIFYVKADTNCDLVGGEERKTCQDITQQLTDLQKSLDASRAATTPLEAEITHLNAQIKSIQGQINIAVAKEKQAEIDIKAREEKVSASYVILSAKTVDLYKRLRAEPLWVSLLMYDKLGEMRREMTYREESNNQDRQIIINLVEEIGQLEIDKKNLEQQKIQLDKLQADLDKQNSFFQGEVKKAKAYQSDLSSQISQLSAKQQQLLAEKLGSLNIPLFAYSTQGGCSSDINPYKDPGFGGDKFAVFTYGVPNRVGLNQYGAWGRAKAGQNYDQILHAYYNFDGYQDMNATIKVNNGNGYDSGNVIWTGSLEDYVKRIWEVPDAWSENDLAALKAQAIAARSYVLSETNNGSKSICANTHCQVFQTNPKGGNWDSAVSQTSGKVMVQNGKPITAWFSSTHGGYIYSSSGSIGGASWTKGGTDTSGSVSNFSDLQSNAYDKQSPWFYCDWGARKQNNNTAWLTSSEMADIVNSILLVQSDSGTDPHILQTDKNDSNMWNEDKVRQELSSHRTPFNTVSSISVDVDFGSGRTTRVHFSGDAGSVDFDGDVFKKYFNLRAPANIQVIGPLFNIEKR